MYSKTGDLIPVFKNNQINYALHSTFHPEKEGLKLKKIYGTSGCFIFLGIGAAYHIMPFLNEKNINNIIIIDKSINYLRSVLENIDMHLLFVDSDLQFPQELA